MPVLGVIKQEASVEKLDNDTIVHLFDGLCELLTEDYIDSEVFETLVLALMRREEE